MNTVTYGVRFGYTYRLYHIRDFWVHRTAATAHRQGVARDGSRPLTTPMPAEALGAAHAGSGSGHGWVARSGGVEGWGNITVKAEVSTYYMIMNTSVNLIPLMVKSNRLKSFLIAHRVCDL